MNGLWISMQAFLAGKPILFVLFSGLVGAGWSVLGESLIYWTARLGGLSRVRGLARVLGINLHHVARAETLFGRWGVALVVFGRIFPGLRAVVSVPAGITRMNFGLFLGASLGGSYLWNTFLVGVSYFLGLKLTLFG